MELRRQQREDRLAGRGDPYPAISELESAWWVWGVAEMGISVSEVASWYEVPKPILQRAVKCWKDNGLLPIKIDDA